MIHAIGEQLATALQTAGIPIPVIDGPERRPTTTFSRERVVLEHFGEDTIISKHRADRNPQTRFSRVVAYKATIYAQNPSKGSAEFEHRRRAEAMVDQVIIALDAIVKARQNLMEWKSGKFVTPDDMKSAETLGGAIYELTFTIDRGVTNASWTGQASPQATGLSLTNTTKVTISDTGTPEIVP